jgi:hypothetical protein
MQIIFKETNDVNWNLCGRPSHMPNKNVFNSSSSRRAHGTQLRSCAQCRCVNSVITDDINSVVGTLLLKMPCLALGHILDFFRSCGARRGVTEMEHVTYFCVRLADNDKIFGGLPSIRFGLSSIS